MPRARPSVSRLEAALQELERLQQGKRHSRGQSTARASTTDPEAHVMRNGEGGTVPSYNVQLMTGTAHGLVVNIEATTDAIDYRQADAALKRCQEKLGVLPRQLVADGDYTNHASLQATAAAGVDFYGSWVDSWKPTEQDAHGRSGSFMSSAFPYDATRDVYSCPAGKILTLYKIKEQQHGVGLGQRRPEPGRQRMPAECERDSSCLNPYGRNCNVGKYTLIPLGLVAGRAVPGPRLS